MPKIILAAFFCILLLSFTYVSDVFQQIGTTMEEARQKTLEQLSHDEFDFYGVTYTMQQVCKQLPLGVREAAVNAAARAVRDYIESPGFKADYQAYLNSQYPMETFNANDEKWGQMKQSKLDELTNTLNMQVPGMDAVQLFAQQLDAEMQGDSSLLAMDDAQFIAMGMSKENFRSDITEDKMLKQLYATNKDAFKKKYAELFAARTVRNEMLGEKNDIKNNNEENKRKITAASDYKSQLRKQLQQMLEQTADIDFTAQLKQEGNTKVFVNPDYESKPPAWKFYFRCGKEYVNSARKFAKDWLKDLQ